MPPHLVSEVDTARRILRTELTREPLDNGAGIEPSLPAAGEREADYHAYYGTEPYWAGWRGVVPGPTGATFTGAFPIEPQARRPAQPDGRLYDPHLRSTGEIESYCVWGMDGELRYLEDFGLDEGTWMIRYDVVDASNWLPGKRVLISPRCISDASRAAAEVHADLGSLEIKEAPAWDPGAPTDREYEVKLHSHYGRPRSESTTAKSVKESSPRRGTRIHRRGRNRPKEPRRAEGREPEAEKNG